MASGAELLKSFLISLGWQHDEGSRKRVVEAEHKTTQELEREQKARDAIDKKRRDQVTGFVKGLASMTTAAEAAAVGVVAAVKQIAEAFDKTYYASQRTGSSAKQLNAFGYAASQMGSSVEEAQSALEGLARAQREMPGFASILKGLGARDPSNLAQSLNDIAPKLAAMPIQQAEAMAQLLHIPENLLLAMRQIKEFQEFEKQSTGKYNVLGFDPEKAAEDGRNLMRLFRDLGDTVQKVIDKFGSDLFQKLKAPLEDLNSYLLAHGKDIAKALTDISEGLLKMLTYVVEHLDDFDKFATSIGGWAKPLTVLAGIVTAAAVAPMVTLLGALTGLSRLVPPPWLLALLGVAATGAAIGDKAKGAFDQGFNAITPGENTPDVLENEHMSAWDRMKKIYREGKDWITGKGGNAKAIDKMAQSQNAQAAIDELRKAGYNDDVIAAAIGSMQTESSFNPRAHNDIAGGHTGAWQWDSNRWPKIRQWILDNHGDPNDFRWQAKAWVAEHNAKPGDAIYDSQQTEQAGKIFRSNPSLADAVHGVRLSERFGPGEEGGRAANAEGWLPHVKKAVELAKRPPMAVPGTKLAPTTTPAVPGSPTTGNVIRLKPLPTAGIPAGLKSGGYLSLGLGADGKPLAPLGVGHTSNDNSRTVNQNLTHNVTVNGVSDPTAAAAQVGARMDRHSSLLLRNMQSAIV